MYAQFLDSRLCGGWYVAETKETARELAETARDTIPAAYRHLHRLGRCHQVSEQEIAWVLGRGGHPVLKKHPVYLAPGLDVKPADTSRGTGWDFTNIQGF